MTQAQKTKADKTSIPAPSDDIFERYLSVEEVAQILRRSPRTIRDWITDGCPTPKGRIPLPAIKLGRAWTMRKDWLVVFEHRVRPDFGRIALDVEDG